MNINNISFIDAVCLGSSVRGNDLVIEFKGIVTVGGEEYDENQIYSLTFHGAQRSLKAFYKAIDPNKGVWAKEYKIVSDIPLSDMKEESLPQLCSFDCRVQKDGEIIGLIDPWVIEAKSISLMKI